MTLSFHTRTVMWLVLASALLGAGIFTAVTGQRARQHAQDQEAALAAATAQLDDNRQHADTYAQLIERIGWRPGQALRHETIDTSATIAGNEGERLNEILRANHVGRGQFFLRSLTLETQRATGSTPGSLKLSIKGDNILVLDRP